MPTWAQSRCNAFDICIRAIRRERPFGSTFRDYIDITNYSHLSRPALSGLGTLARLVHSAICQVVTKVTVPPGSVDLTAGEAIDAGVLARLRIDCDSQGAPLSDELLEIYAAELQPRLGAIHDAISRLDAAALSHAAHALKGGSSVIGARAMAELCLQLEQVARSGAMAEAGALLPELGREAARLSAALAALNERKADQSTLRLSAAGGKRTRQ